MQSSALIVVWVLNISLDLKWLRLRAIRIASSAKFDVVFPRHDTESRRHFEKLCILEKLMSTVWWNDDELYNVIALLLQGQCWWQITTNWVDYNSFTEIFKVNLWQCFYNIGTATLQGTRCCRVAATLTLQHCKVKIASRLLQHLHYNVAKPTYIQDCCNIRVATLQISSCYNAYAILKCNIAKPILLQYDFAEGVWR